MTLHPVGQNLKEKLVRQGFLMKFRMLRRSKTCRGQGSWRAIWRDRPQATQIACKSTMQSGKRGGGGGAGGAPAVMRCRLRSGRRHGSWCCCTDMKLRYCVLLLPALQPGTGGSDARWRNAAVGLDGGRAKKLIRRRCTGCRPCCCWLAALRFALAGGSGERWPGER